MKKSKLVSLVLITAALASCNTDKKKDVKKVFMRSDSTAHYSQSHCYGNGWMWYYAFRPYGSYYDGNGLAGGSYNRAGYYSSGISESSNVGASSTKSNAVRGGFGRSSTVSS